MPNIIKAGNSLQSILDRATPKPKAAQQIKYFLTGLSAGNVVDIEFSLSQRADRSRDIANKMAINGDLAGRDFYEQEAERYVDLCKFIRDALLIEAREET